MFIIYGRLAADGRDARRDAFLARRPRWRRLDKLTRKRGGGVCMRGALAAPVMFYYSNWRRHSKAHHSRDSSARAAPRALAIPSACSWLLTNGIRRGGIQPGNLLRRRIDSLCVARFLFFLLY